ncbi:hypothetical protein BDV96DRAFT_609555 [Lophiotrema nucula]|uniref:Uncharacterized protein n=1 Tax=Lophiotrema nucula TaxID=690887 RepID=A0A6A5ZPX8_9PLEO|nr:hypothetical protein BDV96DRAFT_609555 [Lophiotrema nucula]
MSDIERSFTFLNDSIPAWFKQLTEIEEKVAHMRDEIAKVPVSRSPPLKRRTGSVESIRDLDAIIEDASTSNTPQQTPVMNRKRKTASVLSGQASGPLKYRTRMMVIVQYDGQIQKSFETLVRNIGTGRNMLRKGKMAAKMEALAELAGSEDDSEGDDDDVMAKIGYRHRAGLSSMRARGAVGIVPGRAGASSQEMFDTTDKSLETAQGLCEKAAHQSLRDGDCRKELESARKHFENVLAIANQQVAKYTAQKEKEVQKETSNIDAPVPTSLQLKPTMPDIRATVAAAPTTAKAVDIEIDDESDNDDFVMPPIRLTSRA